MCIGIAGPPYGIPITEEEMQQYSPNLQAAWTTFDTWWHTAFDGENPVNRNAMPADIREAMALICQTPIPGYEEEGFTGSDSCYMNGVNMHLLSD